jgi:Glycosyltransferase
MEQRRRDRVRIPIDERVFPEPAIFFLAPDYNRPSGGVRTLYRHVDILNTAGIRAFVLHQKRNFRCSWFEHCTPVTDISRAALHKSDLLVVTELDIDLLNRLPPDTRHVIFNQGVHLTWTRSAGNGLCHYQQRPGLAGVVTVSEHSSDVLRYAFDPDHLRRIHLSIDSNLFHPDGASRARRIAYMPRRGERDIRPVLEILRARNLLDDWEVVPIDGLAPPKVGEILRTTRIFLSFADQEGFGLPAAEAMACGNYVVGYHGFGGREYFRPSFSAPVPAADILAFASTVEDVLRCDSEDETWCQTRGKEASAFVLSKYSREQEQRDVIETYTELIRDPFSVSARRPTQVRHEPSPNPRDVDHAADGTVMPT